MLLLLLLGLKLKLVLRKRFEDATGEEYLQPVEEEVEVEAVPVPEAEEVAATCSDEAKLGRTRRLRGEGREKVVAQLLRELFVFYVVVFTAIVC